MNTRATSLPEPVPARTVRGSGPGLVLSHGANGSIERQFGPVLDGLAAHRTVVGVDLPGSGATPRSEAPLNADALADQLVAALPRERRPPSLMIALHIWAMAHGIAALFVRGGPSRRKLPMSPEELLEAGMLVYLQGLGLAGGPMGGNAG